jgi:hypothetical protein
VWFVAARIDEGHAFGVTPDVQARRLGEDGRRQHRRTVEQQRPGRFLATSYDRDGV